MKDTTSLEVKKPIAWYNKKVKTDFKKLFTALTKSVFLIGAQDYKGGIKEFIDAFNAFDLKDDANGLAYRLLINAMVNAAHDLAFENRNLFNPEYLEQEKLYDNAEYVQFLEGINSVLEGKELSLNQEVFKNPRSLSFVPDFCNSFEQWLKYFGVEDISVRNIANRLPAYFVMALNDEWRNAPNYYNAILQKTDTPITGAAKRELEWERYNAFLEKQIEEPVFGESFSLKQIYVPLRAYYFKKEENKDFADSVNSSEKEEKRGKKVPFMLTEELSKWLQITDCRHCIKFISGGPGSGKSSFAKMWCAGLAQQGNIRVLFIPLHLFDLQSDVVEAIVKFLERTPEMQFSFNPLDLKGNSDKVLIVFDGLDELSQQGKYASEIASNFVTALHAYSQQINRDGKVKVLFLITGRELAIQSNTSQFRLEQYVFHLLPYFIDYRMAKDEFIGSQENLLTIDQRDTWWNQFGVLKNQRFEKLPDVLKLDRLNEITVQPLLNYLVALSLLRGKIQFSGGTNLNAIYEDLIEGVHERAYENHRSYKAIESLTLNDFKRILEEIGVSAWHGGDVRTTSIKKIEQHIEKSGLKQLMDKFEKEAEKGIIRLLTAFYFRQHGVVEGDKTFEFTHKSFGEYLTAVRIIKLVERISEEIELKNKEYDRGWSEEEALRKWMEVTGPSPIDKYLFEFLLDEVKNYPVSQLITWQSNLAKLLSKCIRDGLPMPEPRLTQKQEVKLSRNASEAILVLHSACSKLTNEVSEIKTNSNIEFGEWFSTLQSQRAGAANILGFSCLNNLNLSSFILDIKDFYRVNFQYSNLSKTQLNYAILVGANLNEANLSGANLNEANLSGANLNEANLSGANLSGANLREADVKGTILESRNTPEA